MEDTVPQLKILYLITKSNFGGAQSYVYDLAVAGKTMGHDVIVGFGGSGMLATKLAEAGVRTVSIKELERDINFVADVKSFFAILRLIVNEKPDVVHLNSSKMGGIGALAARIANGVAHAQNMTGKKEGLAKIIFTGHGWAFNEERGDFQRFIIGALHFITIQLAHKTITVSKRTRDQIAALPFVFHKLAIVHNGIGPVAVCARNEAQKILLGNDTESILAGAPLIVGSIAELHKNKGLSHAIEGIAQLKKQRPNEKVLFIVISEGEERGTLEKLIDELELRDRIFLVGLRERAATLLSAFDIFLLPSITEAFPYAILEAGKVGLPVVATAVGGIPEVIDDMESGILIQSKNSGEIARAIAYLIDNPKRRVELGNTLAARIRDRFSIEDMVAKTFALYEEV